MGKKRNWNNKSANAIIKKKNKPKQNCFYDLCYVTCIYCMMYNIPLSQIWAKVSEYNNRQYFSEYRKVCGELGFTESVFKKIVEHPDSEINAAINHSFYKIITEYVSLKKNGDSIALSTTFKIQIEELLALRITILTDLSGKNITGYRYSFSFLQHKIKSEIYTDPNTIPLEIQKLLQIENFNKSTETCSIRYCNSDLLQEILSLTDSKQLIWKYNNKMYRACGYEMKLCYIGNKKTALCGCIGIDNGDRTIYYVDSDYAILDHLMAQINNVPVNSVSNVGFTSDLHDETRHIDITDFMVRTMLSKCVHEEHKLVNINAMVKIMSNHIIKEYPFPAMYCNNCKRYYIYENTYQRMKKLGHICCKVTEYNTLKNASTGSFGEWASKSILNLYGYNVNRNSDLSAVARHEILDFIIENHIMSPYEVINHLEMLSNLRNNLPNMKTAIEKWQDDITYVQDQNVNGLYNVKVNRIVRK